MKMLPTFEQMAAEFEYDESTGVIFRKSGRYAGIATSDTKYGYLSVSFKDRNFQAHRVAFLLKTGSWPPPLLDHRDTNKTNNRWSNLRISTKQKNAQNLRKAHRDNMTGFLGVTMDKRDGRYDARIKDESGRNRSLGRFATAEQAHEAYIAAKLVLHPGAIE